SLLRRLSLVADLRACLLVSVRPLLKRGSELLKVGERVNLPANLLARLVALTSHHDRITGAGPCHRSADGVGAAREVVIKNLLAIRIAALGSLAHPVQDHRANRGGLLVARVVVGDEDGVGDLRSLLAHHGALVVIAVAASSQHVADATCRRRQVVDESQYY